MREFPSDYEYSIINEGGTHLLCDWCPNHPRFATPEDLLEHVNTHGRLKYDHMRFYKRIQDRKNWAQGRGRRPGPRKRKEREPFVETKLALFKKDPWKTGGPGQ